MKLWVFFPCVFKDLLKHDISHRTTAICVRFGLSENAKMVTYLFLFVRDMSFASSLLTQDHAAPCLCVCYRAFQSLSYVRFGNVFIKCRRQGASDPSLR